MVPVDIRIAPYHSEWQKQSIALRHKILREPLGLHYTPQQLAEEKDEIHIVALNKNDVIAIGLLKDMGEGVLKMRQVAVAEDWQRSGIGTRLIQFIEQFARQHQYRKIVLHARDSAREFYARHGYIIEGDVFSEVGIPHYKMYKVIPRN
jgi:predicted GNAT family N-acyltransferase